MDIKINKTEQRKRPSLSEKKIILEKIFKGEQLPEEILLAHNVRTPAHMVVKRWSQQLTKHKGIYHSKRLFPEQLKKDIIRQIDFGSMRESEAIDLYGLGGRSQLKKWREKYSSEIISAPKIKHMPETELSEISAIEQQKRELEQALTEANLKIIGLETMIDVAEKEFNLEIRKKSGTKQ